MEQDLINCNILDRLLKAEKCIQVSVKTLDDMCIEIAVSYIPALDSFWCKLALHGAYNQQKKRNTFS